jgi:sirohydrochlorin ferrochelatase
LKEALALSAAGAPAQVIVQPHLLFEGLLSAEVRAAVAEARELWPHTLWCCAAPLGPEPEVLRALRSACERR